MGYKYHNITIFRVEGNLIKFMDNDVQIAYVVPNCVERFPNYVVRHQSERAWLPPCVVLVINDNLYGLIFALSSMCRLSFSLCQDHLLIKAKLVFMCWSQGALLDLHLLESSSREEEEDLG